MKFGDVGARIKEKRKEKKLTQAQLADAIDKTESSIRKYEKNLVEIPCEVMEKIAIALGTTVSYLDGIDEIKASVEEYQAFLTLLENLGFQIFFEGIIDENGDVLSESRVIIEYQKEQYLISLEEYNTFEQDIKKYIKFRLSELISDK